MIHQMIHQLTSTNSVNTGMTLHDIMTSFDSGILAMYSRSQCLFSLKSWLANQLYQNINYTASQFGHCKSDIQNCIRMNVRKRETSEFVKKRVISNQILSEYIKFKERKLYNIHHIRWCQHVMKNQSHFRFDFKYVYMTSY